MIVKIDGRGIKKPVASVYSMEDNFVLRIDDEDNAEVWVEVVLDSRTLEDAIYTVKDGKLIGEPP